MEMDPVKVASFWDWPTPRNMTEVQSFVGFINFYNFFIWDFSHISKPLHQLTKKEVEWWWAKEEQGAFEELKHLIMSTPVLVQPNQDVLFRLEANALGHATGAVLSQLSDDVTSECTALLSQMLGFRGVSDSGFSLCAAPTYYCGSEYFLVSIHKFGT